MNITPEELTNIYKSVIETSGHPDPLGYISRAYLLSGGDINFHDDEKGRIGFYPVKPQDAFDIVGSTDIATLQGNIITTLRMEMVLIDQLGYEEAINFMSYGESLKGIDEIQKLIEDIVYPRNATVDDVISLLKPYLNNTEKLSKSREKFFKQIMEL